MLSFFRNDMGFGGNNGFTDFKDILGFNLQQPETRVVLVALTALVLGISYVLCCTIVRSRAGRMRWDSCSGPTARAASMRGVRRRSSRRCRPR